MLKSFYVEARKKDGSSYSMGSLKALRFGLNRHFKAVRGVDIMNEEEFSEANKVFAAKCVQLKKDGQAKLQHKPLIADADLQLHCYSEIGSTRECYLIVDLFDLVTVFWVEEICISYKTFFLHKTSHKNRFLQILLTSKAFPKL